MFRQYYSNESATQLLEKPEVLSVIAYNTECKPCGPGIIPCGLTSLSNHNSEVIEANGKIQRGMTGGCQWSATEELMCAAVWISAEDCNNIEHSTTKAYIELLRHFQNTGYANLIRMWNFIPDINIGEGDREAYKRFCTGRLNAFSEMGLDTKSFPSASALGHHSQGAVIYAIASTVPGIHYENPKQQSAYAYPRQYGPSSPSFARATKLQSNGSEWVFISGTASILGHETQYPESIEHQIQTTLNNIQHLSDHISPGNKQFNGVRAYLRHESDLAPVQKEVSQFFKHCDITYTKADICRSNLLVEIEAAFSQSPT